MSQIPVLSSSSSSRTEWRYVQLSVLSSYGFCPESCREKLSKSQFGGTDLDAIPSTSSLTSCICGTMFMLHVAAAVAGCGQEGAAWMDQYHIRLAFYTTAASGH